MIFAYVNLLTLTIMNTKIIPRLVALTLFLIVLSCEDSTFKEYTGNLPVYMSYSDLRSSVTVEQSTALKNPGKIYFKDNFIFIIEELKGIHVYDNSNPSSPVQKSFVNVPGAVDMAISGNVMYVDSYVDLVALDLQDINNIHEAGRMKNAITYTVPATGNNYPVSYVDENKGVVTGWDVKKIRERVYTQPIDYPIYTFESAVSGFNKTDASSVVSNSGIGVGGSMARFGIKDNVLYLLGKSQLTIIDITSKSAPVKLSDMFPGANPETIFITGNSLFLGTTTGMLIYNISNPTSPTSRILFTHARSCDPVIVDDTLAYITLRTGTTCNSTLNTLDIVNVKDLAHPSAVTTYAMTNPHGLGKSGNLLFVCDGDAGLKIFDASYPKQLMSHVIKTYPGINAYDVIPLGNVLIMIGDQGLFQYNCSNIQNITLLSTISVAAD
jgi:hypothetical protein